MLRKRLNRRSLDTHNEQQELDEIFTSLNSLLELHSNLYDLQKQTMDPVIKKAYADTKNEIVSKVRTLYQKNISVVDLVKRYGSLLVKSQILQAEEMVSKKENEQGELQLTDLVSEDQKIADRLKPFKQQGIELGYFSSKISQENLLKSKRLQEIAQVLARREVEAQQQQKLGQDVEEDVEADLAEEQKREESDIFKSVAGIEGAEEQEALTKEQIEKVKEFIKNEEAKLEEAKKVEAEGDIPAKKAKAEPKAEGEEEKVEGAEGDEIENAKEELSKLEGDLKNVLETKHKFKEQNEKVVERYRQSRRKELVDLKIDSFTKDYDDRLKQALKNYTDKYTPLVAQFNTPTIKDLINLIKKYGEERVIDEMVKKNGEFERAESDGEPASIVEESKGGDVRLKDSWIISPQDEEFKGNEDIISVATMEASKSQIQNLAQQVLMGNKESGGKAKDGRSTTNVQLEKLIGNEIMSEKQKILKLEGELSKLLVQMSNKEQKNKNIEKIKTDYGAFIYVKLDDMVHSMKLQQQYIENVEQLEKNKPSDKQVQDAKSMYSQAMK